jgi:drug/metabolite transporter (DMT)-like permease
MIKNKLPIIAFVILGVVWGSNFIYMKWASEFISPLQIVFIRVLFGFIPVCIYALIRKELKLKDLKHSIHFFVISLLGTTIYYYFFVKASSLLLSGLAGALSGSIPVFTFILALMFIKEEKANVFSILGIIIGFIGVVLIAKPFELDIFNANIEGVISVVVGSFVIGSSFVYAKKFIVPLKLHFSALATYQLGFALLVLFFVVDLNGIGDISSNTHVLVGSILGLGLLGTGIAYIIYYYLIETLGAIVASSVTYLPPIVALFIGYVFIGENITLLDCIATLFIFIGVFLINKRAKNDL